MHPVGWRAAMETALYGPGGFFVSGSDGPAGHFRTSVHASPLFAGAVAELVRRIDVALGRPKTFDIVDVGAGRGELLTALQAGGALDDRFRLVGVDLAARPTGLDPRVAWRHEVPDGVVGLLLATEWLDNVPLDVADAQTQRKILVDPATGEERLGAPMDPADRMWAARWWPACPDGDAPDDGRRIEIGWPRDLAWADAVGSVRRGGALAVDYGHLREGRPLFGTLTGFRGGRQISPVPDGSCDVTAHVAMDAVAVAGGGSYALRRQREALKALGVDGARPSLELARDDPTGYLRRLSLAGAAAELLDPAGLGGHWWLLHTIDLGERGTMLW
ncbi:SAM-dependent methyltransferase [Actinoplanes sp. NPDC051633]|uniref:SAM-dependent methyltransferase n=1 Tax=Actinoplanes sp. NPDC051633 TaxID=3155670 RepID=UPI003427221A